MGIKQCRTKHNYTAQAFDFDHLQEVQLCLGWDYQADLRIRTFNFLDKFQQNILRFYKVIKKTLDLLQALLKGKIKK